MHKEIFTFHETGFTVRFKNEKTIEWNEMKSLIGYKVDCLTFDEICLDIFCDAGYVFRITEGTQGWISFLENSKKAFPQIDKNWEGEIAVPAFKTNLTVVYDRENRTLEELEKEYYQEKSI